MSYINFQQGIDAVAASVLNRPKWFKYTVTYLDLSSPSNTVIYGLISALPAKSVVHNAVFKVNTAFTGGSNVAAVMALESITTADIIPSTSVFTIPASLPVSPSLLYLNFSTTSDVNLTLVTTGDTTGALSSGSLDVYILISQLP